MAMEQFGKVRNVPHKPGKWPCFISISGSLSIDRDCLAGIMATLKDTFCPNIQLEEKPHLSLSQTFYAHHWHLDSLCDRLNSSLLSQRNKLSLSKTMKLSSLAAYQNEEKTRSFLAMNFDQDSQKLLHDATRAIDEVLVGFGFPPYYEDPSFHISFAWSPGCEISDSILPMIQDRVPLRDVTWNCKQVVLKAGDRLYTLLNIE